MIFQKPLVLLLVSAFAIQSCKVTPIKRELKMVSEAASINPNHKFVKAHMKDGTVYILHDWLVNRESQKILGSGKHLDVNRRVLAVREPAPQYKTGQQFEIDMQSIALMETNDIGKNLNGGLVVMTGVSAALTIICLANPKACFGSCPTFYAFNGDTLTLQAEGFSTSVSPTLEKNDIDMLYHAVPNKKFELIVTNEALETHSIRYSNILALKKEKDKRVFVTPEGDFFKSNFIQGPIQAIHEGNEISSKLSKAEGTEFFTLTDEHDLNTKEEIELTFAEAPVGEYGLVIGKRQSLLTTFLMYQGLSYMGATATYWLSQLELGKFESSNGIFALLGGIEVYARNKEGDWIMQGQVNETGPIATDFTLIPLQEKNVTQLKLRMNKGLWRLDYVALVRMNEKVDPVVITPSFVERIRGLEDDPFTQLTDPDQYLVTYPGDAYRIQYDLPDTSCELFLDSRGYYLEWMRDEWIKEQDLGKLRVMIKQPAKYLKKIAPAYKKLEPSMEETFWNSRYVKD
jgi:hypothetical protein